MNWDNKELQSMIDNVMDPNFSIDLPSSRELLRSYLRYAYTLGKSDGFTEGVLAMSPKGAKEAT
jgi:hypothetical protein